MSTIDVTDRLVVHADDVFVFNDEIGFLLQGDGAPQLINEGRISLSMTAEDYRTALITSTADGALIWNRSEGLIRFHAGFSAGPEVFAIQSFGNASTLRNDGRALFQADREVIATLDDGSDGSRFINTGLWRVQGGDKAGGGYFRVAEIVNSGDFIVTGADVFGINILGSPASGASLHNSGLIKVSGTSSAACVSLFDADPDFRLENSGQMVAHSWGFPSIGITLPAIGDAVIENSGLIRAEKAIWSAGGYGNQTIINSGHIVGDVLLGDGFDLVTNTGSIRGDVQLGNGWDSYDGSQGVLKGVLWGGGGCDTIVGSKAADEIHGDEVVSYWSDGADLLKGGAGADSLFGGGGSDTLEGGKDADFLHGEGGADVLDGGRGADVYVFSALSESAPDAADSITAIHADDWIDLSPIDADPSKPGDQAFAPDQVALSFDKATGQTSITIDADRDGTADFLLVIEAGHVSFDQLVL